MNDLDTTLLTLHAKPSTAGVWADWFEERGVERVGAWLRAANTISGDALLYGLIDGWEQELFYSIAPPGGMDLWWGYRSMVRSAVGPAGDEVFARGGDSWPVFGLAAAVRVSVPAEWSSDRLATHCGPCDAAGWYVSVELRAFKFGNQHTDHTGRRARITFFRWLGTCERCGAVHTSPTLTPADVRAEFEFFI